MFWGNVLCLNQCPYWDQVSLNNTKIFNSNPYKRNSSVNRCSSITVTLDIDCVWVCLSMDYISHDHEFKMTIRRFTHLNSACEITYDVFAVFAECWLLVVRLRVRVYSVSGVSCCCGTVLFVSTAAVQLGNRIVNQEDEEEVCQHASLVDAPIPICRPSHCLAVYAACTHPFTDIICFV